MSKQEKKVDREARPRARDLGITPGLLSPGRWNAITDVAGVRVGHVTVVEGADLRTGATAILPHGGNVYQQKVPAGLAVGNGYGKLLGATQIEELGEVETPIVLTNTLSVPAAAEAILDWTLAQAGNEAVRSVNPVVGETNDGVLNDIRRRVLTRDMIRGAIEAAREGPVEEGAVGAGTGTMAFGWKGGIGTSSRLLSVFPRGYAVGSLVQTNLDGALEILGVPVGIALGRDTRAVERKQGNPLGSVLIVLATDAPLSDRSLVRLGRRGLAALARTGASLSNTSGDYAIAFSTAPSVRRSPKRRQGLSSIALLPDERISPLFQAALEATEEAIYNSLFRATTVVGFAGAVAEAIPVDAVVSLLRSGGRLA